MPSKKRGKQKPHNNAKEPAERLSRFYSNSPYSLWGIIIDAMLFSF